MLTSYALSWHQYLPTHIEATPSCSLGENTSCRKRAPLKVTLLPWPCMPLAHSPLIQELQGDVPQSWYADNATDGGKLRSLRTWWDRLKTAGTHYRYHPNPAKTWLVVKPEHHEVAAEVFRSTGINITEGGMNIVGPIWDQQVLSRISFKTKWLNG